MSACLPSLRKLLLSLCLLAPLIAQASTYDEPWHRDVVRAADTFGLFEVEAVGEEEVRLKTVRSLAGKPTTGTIVLDPHRWSRLAWTREHEHGHGASFKVGERLYLHLAQDGERWLMATPSAGVSGLLEDGSVAAVYRNSLEKAMQPADAYERVQVCVFRHLHGDTCAVATLGADLAQPLSEPAAALSRHASQADAERFFRQHVALEGAYLLGTSWPVATLEPFLANDFFHVQRSAVRALRASNDPGRDARLLAFIADATRDPAARVNAVLMAKEIADPALTKKIKALRIEDAEASLPFESIMDPRVGTRFPESVQAAIDGL